MGKILEWLNGKKTYILAIGTIIGAWYGVYTGALTPNEAITATLGALGLGSLRSAVAKGPTQ